STDEDQRLACVKLTSCSGEEVITRLRRRSETQLFKGEGFMGVGRAGCLNKIPVFHDFFAWKNNGRMVYNPRLFSSASLFRTYSMFDKSQTIASFDPEIWASIQNEGRRQEEHIELIASENYTSPLVMAAQGTKLTNKYAEGYPGKRYYGGCEYVDQSEALAIERAKQLFGADYANVQPHSGSQANSAVYAALCAPGDTVL